MRCTVTQFIRESVGLCPFRGSYVREFELSQSNLVSRIRAVLLDCRKGLALVLVLVLLRPLVG